MLDPTYSIMQLNSICHHDITWVILSDLRRQPREPQKILYNCFRRLHSPAHDQ